MAGFRVGQAYGVFHRPGFGLLGSVPRSLSTQPPFATQALNNYIIHNFAKKKASEKRKQIKAKHSVNLKINDFSCC